MSTCNPLVGKVRYRDWKKQTCKDQIRALLDAFDYKKPYDSFTEEEKGTFRNVIQTYYDPKENKALLEEEIPCDTDILKAALQCLVLPEKKQKPKAVKITSQQPAELFKSTEEKYLQLIDSLKALERTLSSEIQGLENKQARGKNVQRQLQKRQNQLRMIQNYIQNITQNEQTYRTTFPKLFPESFSKSFSKLKVTQSNKS
jgi:hypothetical protein